MVVIGVFNANCDLADILKIWFSKSKGHIHNLLPIVIIGYLWKGRNDYKNKEIKMYANQIISNVRDKILLLISVNLISKKYFMNFNLLANYFAKLTKSSNVGKLVRIVRWFKPSAPFVKLNTDGSVSATNAGMGGIIRDHTSNLIVVFSGPLFFSVLSTELLGLYNVLDMCLRLGIYNVNIEVNHNLVIHVISDNYTGCPQDFYTIRKIKMALSMLTFTTSHICREGNACADWLDNFGAQSEIFQEHLLNNLPIPLRGMITLDKIGLPYIRHG
ncbi:uncharacterized protein LOC114580138 [Dendrobium catenatum]|uniref:uncharacterized protein LOC114580138 n=1 Tax=Dendrobium catenatum TaxID=906689 RepID=UPI00109F5274|nr:uncharacterized protein LOC114580138 [Dendrobium catenatum]